MRRPNSMKRILLFLATLCTSSSVVQAQGPAAIDYTLNIDSVDGNSFYVQMRVRSAPASFIVAAHAHPEYDDKYWRYLEGMRAENAIVQRLDSVRWQVTGSRG